MPENPTLFGTLREAVERGRPVAAATTLRAPDHVGAKMLIFADGRIEGSLGDAALDDRVAQDARRLLADAQPEMRSYPWRGAMADVFIEVYPAPPRLILFGGVHTAIPLARLARTLGFRVVVVDARATFANRDRFPDVDEIVVAWPDEAAERLDIDANTYVAILTHDPKIDEPAIKAVIDTPARYIGAIGSRKTHAERFARMAQQGVPPEKLQRVYAPIGLDLGGKTPEEIALAVLAEIVAVRNGRSGGHLRDETC
jgi:xanthine dehydrogenase accessory factor